MLGAPPRLQADGPRSPPAMLRSISDALRMLSYAPRGQSYGRRAHSYAPSLPSYAPGECSYGPGVSSYRPRRLSYAVGIHPLFKKLHPRHRGGLSGHIEAGKGLVRGQNRPVGMAPGHDESRPACPGTNPRSTVLPQRGAFPQTRLSGLPPGGSDGLKTSDCRASK